MNKKHLALYAKGQYICTNDIINDLKIVLNADGNFCSNKHDVYNLLTITFDNLPDDSFSKVRNLLDGINPKECWKYGYYTQDHDWLKSASGIQYDFEMAVIYYVLSYIRMKEIDDLGGLPEADSNVLTIGFQ